MRNRIIASLRPVAQEFIIERVHTRQTSAGEVLYEEGGTLEHAVFPHSGLVSLMAEMDNGRSVEKTAIGPEGFLGFVLIMGGSNAISRTVVRVPGHASWLPIADLNEALERFQCVRETMLRYARSLITQLMETVACNSLHSAEQRVIRWLLHAHDSVGKGRFALTQQAVAEALGLRRATVSEICSQLQGAGLLDYSRGDVSILERQAMEARACECFHRICRAYRHNETG